MQVIEASNLRKDTAVKEGYDEVIGKVTNLLSETMLCVENECLHAPLELDEPLKEVLRRIGQEVMWQVLSSLTADVTAEAIANDSELVPQRRGVIKTSTVFGEVKIESPYLWRPGHGERPAESMLGLCHGKRSVAVQRALTDFGAEESFAQAAVRFKEHYGWTIGRTSVLHLVERRAREAEAYVDLRLAKEAPNFDKPLGERPGVEELLVELDGCEIRTGTLVDAGTGEKTPVREQDKRKRVEQWRDVRVGLTRRLDEVDRTYVAKMDSYPVVVGQLFNAAVGRGLSSRTTTVAVADGGKGLREELAVQFPNLRFIYDRPHLKQHLFDTAEAMGLKEADRHRFVDDKVHRIDKGGAWGVLLDLDAYRGRGRKRVKTLRKHLSRFADAVHYDAFRQAGFPVGSGEVESAHRYIPQKRLKIPGASWHPSTINPMLALRVIRANGWWDDFWHAKRSEAIAS